jgi:hypothetical protein
MPQCYIVYYSVPHFPFQDSLSLVSPGDGRNDSEVIDHRISLASSHDFGAGIVTSPRGTCMYSRSLSQ